MHTIALLLAQHSSASPKTLGAFCLATPDGRCVLAKTWEIWKTRSLLETGLRHNTTWKALGEKNQYLTRSEVRKRFKLSDDLLRRLDAKVVYHNRHSCDMTLFDQHEIEAAARAFYGIPANQSVDSFMTELAKQPSAARRKRDALLEKALADPKLFQSVELREAIMKSQEVRDFLESGKYGIRALKTNVVAPMSRLYQSISVGSDEVKKWFATSDNVWAAHRAGLCASGLAKDLIAWVEGERIRKDRSAHWPKIIDADVIAYLGRRRFSKIADHYIQTGVWDIEKDPAMAEQIQRCLELLGALKAAGLSLREDSALCREYIFEEKGSVADIVRIMDEMHFLYTRTNYAAEYSRRCDAAYEDLKSMQIYDRDEIREEMIEQRKQISQELREKYLCATRIHS